MRNIITTLKYFVLSLTLIMYFMCAALAATTYGPLDSRNNLNDLSNKTIAQTNLQSLTYVDNFAALQSYPVISSTGIVCTKSYSAVGDGGQGCYSWLNGDVTTPNQVTIVSSTAPGAPTGNWYLAVGEDGVNVLQAGADRNNVADSTAAFNAAAAAVSAGNRLANVFVPAGKYRITNALTFGAPSFSQCFVGQGWNSVIAVSSDFNASATGLFVPTVSGNPSVRPCVQHLYVQYATPSDLTTTTTASSAATNTSIVVASPAGIVTGMNVQDMTATTAIPLAFPSSTTPTTVISVVGNTVNLSRAITGPGVGNGDSIHFNTARSLFANLGSCTVTAGGTGCKYPPTVFNNGSFNMDIEDVLITGAWDGPKLRGSAFYGKHVYIQAFDVGVDIDNCFNFPHWDDYQFWTFGLSGPLLNVLYDGSAVAAKIGETDGGIFAGWQVFVGSVNLTSTFSWGEASNWELDTPYAHLNAVGNGNPTNSFITINGFYPRVDGNTNGDSSPGISVSAMRVSIDNYSLVTAGSEGGFTVSGTGELHLSHGHMWNGLVSSVSMGTVSAGFAEVTDSYLDASSSCAGLSGPYFAQSGTGILRLTGNTFTSTCVSPGVAGASFATDVAGNYVNTNVWGSWTLTGPTGAFSSGPLGTYVAAPSQLARSVTNSTDTQLVTDNSILLNRSGGVAETLSGCGTNNNNALLTVADKAGTAATAPDTLTPSSGNIGGGASFVIAINGESVSLVCDGASTNWRVN